MPWVPYDAGQAYLEFYRPAVHVMRSLKQQGELDSLQAAFFALKKPQEELYDLREDPHETENLIEDPAHQRIVEKMRNLLDDWQNRLPKTEPKDFNFVTPGAPDLLEWVKYQKTDQYLDMLRGEEIGFQQLNQQYRSIAN